MAQAITPLHTHREIVHIAIDLRTNRIILTCTEGTETEGEYQPARPFERMIEGKAFEDLGSRVFTIQEPHQTFPTTLRELIKRVLYPYVL
ncbi:hypothetical protein D3C86_1164050 [compost metagenome]